MIDYLLFKLNYYTYMSDLTTPDVRLVLPREEESSDTFTLLAKVSDNEIEVTQGADVLLLDKTQAAKLGLYLIERAATLVE